MLLAALLLVAPQLVFSADNVVLPGSGAAQLGRDDTLELVLKLPGNEANAGTPSLRAWLLASDQAPPAADAPENGRAFIWPSPTRNNEYIVHLRGLAPPANTPNAKWDILLRWTIPGGPAGAAGEERIKQAATFRTGLPNVVLLLDGSGSMTESDPSRSRVEAARRFIQAGKTSGGIGNIAIVQFATTVHELLPLTPVSEEARFAGALRQITADGYTDIDGSIRKAVEILRAGAGAGGTGSAAIVLLTDGMQEPGDYTNAHKLAKEAGIPIHTVGLGADADLNLLERIADETGGTFAAAAKGQELLRIYGAIATGILGGRTILTTNIQAAPVSIPIDGACRTLVASVGSEAGGSLALTSPKGESDKTDPQSPPIFYKISPAVGTWQAQWSGRAAKFEASAHTPLYPLFFRATAESDGVVEINPDDPRVALSLADATAPIGIGSTVEVTLEVPDHQPLTGTLYDDGAHDDGAAGDGVFAGSLTQLAKGEIFAGTTGTLTATITGKRAGGEDFRREVRAHCLITRGNARSLAVPRELDFGDQYPGSTAQSKLNVRARGGGGNLICRSAPPAQNSPASDLSRALRIAAPAAIQDHAEIPVQFEIPAELLPGNCGGVIELSLSGNGRAEVRASVPWRARVRTPVIAADLRAIDLGDCQPGQQLQRRLVVSTRGGRAALTGLVFQESPFDWLVTRPTAAPLAFQIDKLACSPAMKLPLSIDSAGSTIGLTFTILPDTQAGPIAREIVCSDEHGKVLRVPVTVNVLPESFDVAGNLDLGRFESGDSAVQSLTWRLNGAAPAAEPGVDVAAISNSPQFCAASVEPTENNTLKLTVSADKAAPAGRVEGTLWLHGGAADTLKRWTAEIVRPELKLSTAALDLGSLYPGQSRKVSFHADFSGIKDTAITAALDAAPNKALVPRIHLPDDALRVTSSAPRLAAGQAAELNVEIHAPDSAQDGAYKAQINVDSRLGRITLPVAFQVVFPVPLPPFHVSPAEIVLNVYDDNSQTPPTQVGIMVSSQTDLPIAIRVHGEPAGGFSRCTAELIHNGEAVPELNFTVPGRAVYNFLVRAGNSATDGDRCQLIVESGSERQAVLATVVRSHLLTAAPKPQTEGFDWWSLLLIIPLLLCAIFVRKLVKRRWVRVASYSALLHFAVFFFIIIPASHKDDSFGGNVDSIPPGVALDLNSLLEGVTAETSVGGDSEPAAVAGPRGGDTVAALGGGKPDAMDGLKGGGDAGPGGPAAAAELQKAGAGDARPSGSGPVFERAPSSGGPDDALVAESDPGGPGVEEPRTKIEPAAVPVTAHVPLAKSLELPAGQSGPVGRPAPLPMAVAVARQQTGGGNPNEKIVVQGHPGASRGNSAPLAIDDAPLLADALGAPAEAKHIVSTSLSPKLSGDPGATARGSTLVVDGTPGASIVAQDVSFTAPAAQHSPGAAGAVVPENGKAWGAEGSEKGMPNVGVTSARSAGALTDRGDDTALDASPVLGDGAGSPIGKLAANGANATGTGVGAPISAPGSNGIGGNGGDGSAPRGGIGLTAAKGSGKGAGNGDGIGSAGSGTGFGIGRGAGPGNSGTGGPGGLGLGYAGTGGNGLGGRVVGAERLSGPGLGGNGKGTGFGDAPLDLGGAGSGTGGPGRGSTAGSGAADNGRGHGTGTGNGDGNGGPGSPQGVPGGLATMGNGKGIGGTDIGISTGSGHGLGLGPSNGSSVSGYETGLPGSHGDSIAARTVGSRRGPGTGNGLIGAGDAPLDAGPLGTGPGTGVAQGTGRGGNGNGPGNGNGAPDGGPPGPRGNGPLATPGLPNGTGLGNGGLVAMGNGRGMIGAGFGNGVGPANPGGNGTGRGAGSPAVVEGLVLDRSGRSDKPNPHRLGAQSTDRPQWGPPTGAILRVTIGFAKHSADWNSSPTSLFHLTTAFRERCGLPDAVADVASVDLNDPKAMAKCRFLLFTANYPIVFSDAEMTAMRTYAEHGGVLWFNDSGAEGDERFDIAIRKDFERLFPGKKLEKLEMTHLLFHAAYDLSHGYKGYRIPPGDKYRQEAMEGITIAGAGGAPRTAVIYTRNDYADGLEIDPRNIAGMPSLTDLTAEEMLEGSLRFGVNLIAYSLGSDAPRMPPPPESTAQFEKIYRYNGPAIPPFDNFDLQTGADGKPVWEIADWANPATLSYADDPGGVHALKIEFKSGDKMKAGVSRNLMLDLDAAAAVVVDIFSALPHGFNVATMFQTKPNWASFESRPIFIRPGWNRNVRFPLNLDDFKTAKNEWKAYDQPFRPRNSVGKIFFLFYNLEENGAVRMESLRIEK